MIVFLYKCDMIWYAWV